MIPFLLFMFLFCFVFCLSPLCFCVAFTFHKMLLFRSVHGSVCPVILSDLTNEPTRLVSQSPGRARTTPRPPSKQVGSSRNPVVHRALARRLECWNGCVLHYL